MGHWEARAAESEAVVQIASSVKFNSDEERVDILEDEVRTTNPTCWLWGGYVGQTR